MAPQNTTPAALCQRLVQDVLADARPLMERLIEATRLSLQARENQARTAGEHQAMLDARQQLTRLAPVMGERYPDALRKALNQETAQREKSTRSLFAIHFDELELMDETQVSESVERARARQILASAVEGPLADLDALVSAALGLPKVLPENNPLRPEIFLQALQAVVSQMQASAQVRHDWMGQMAQALGNELRTLYPALAGRLKQGGVRPVGYAMRQADGQYVYVAQAEGGATPGFAAEADLPAAPGAADPLLTLDRLRRLLLGEFTEPPSPADAATDESFAERFAREFDDAPGALPAIDAPATDFAMTVPAAFEALQEMNQVGRIRGAAARRAAPPAGGQDLARCLAAAPDRRRAGRSLALSHRPLGAGAGRGAAHRQDRQPRPGPLPRAGGRPDLERPAPADPHEHRPARAPAAQAAAHAARRPGHHRLPRR